jgi:Tol biopolymer transport system component
VDHLIGRGGIGEVYLARDERLDRLVVLKTLRPRSTLLSQYRQRFQREALALSHLSHPTIATIFDFQQLDGVDFLVMEYVEGITLAARIHQGVMGNEELLRTVRRICDALVEAHDHGILHRDLSPANVMVTDKGVVKVLDFGLAKWIPEPASPESPTATTWATKHIAGTVPYIAPERLRGNGADERSDIYSLGALVYEMATRKRIFEGDSQAELIASTLDKNPVPVSKLRDDLPPGMAECIDKALEKDPARRYQSARDMAFDIDQVRLHLGLPAARKRIPWIRRSLLALGIVAVALFLFFRPRAPHFPEATEMTALATGPQWEGSCRLSPDGRWFSYQIEDHNHTRLIQRSIAGSDERVLVDVAGEIVDHDWAPDGSRIGYLRRSSEGTLLQMVPAFGGTLEESHLLPEAIDTIVSMRWARSGVFVDGGLAGLWRFDLQSGDWTQALPAEGKRIGFDVSRDGRRCVYSVKEGSRFAIWTTNLVDGSSQRLTHHDRSDIRPLWLGDGSEYVVHTSNRSGQSDLWLTDLKGRSQRLTFGASVEYAASSSADGSLLSYSEQTHRSDLWILDRRPGHARESRLTGDTLEDMWPSVSPSAGLVAFQRRARAIDEFDPAFDSQIMVGKMSGDGLTDLRTVAPHGGMPRISPDGRWLAFYQQASGRPRRLALLDLQSGHSQTVGNELRAPLFDSNPFRPFWTDLEWSADSSTLFFVTQDSVGSHLRSTSSAMGHASREWVSVGKGWVRQPVLSEDGSDLAYVFERPVTGDAGTGSLRLSAEVHLRNLATDQDRTLCSRQSDEPSLLLILGQRVNGEWLIAETHPAASSHPHTAFFTLSGGGPGQVLEDLDGTVGSCVLVAGEDRVLLAWSPPETGIQNLYALDLGDSSLEKLSSNANPQETNSQPAVLSDGRVLYTRHDRNNDLWLIRFGP